MRTSGPGNEPGRARLAPALNFRAARGFTLLELLVVVAVIAIATASVAFALRDSAATVLEREAQRLSALFESARAQSRSSGAPVLWVPVEGGFRFEGLKPGALPDRWLHAPWDAPAAILAKAGIRLGRDYPLPIVALDEGRDRALKAFRDTVRTRTLDPPPSAAAWTSAGCSGRSAS